MSILRKSESNASTQKRKLMMRAMQLYMGSSCPDGNIRGKALGERPEGKSLLYRLFYLLDHLENNIDGCIRNKIEHEKS